MRNIKLLALLILIVSCSDIIEVEDIKGRAVTTLAPNDASVLTNTSINFSWNTVEDAESYRLQIASPNFEAATVIVQDTTVIVTSFSKTLNSGNYEWRIRAENSNYKTAYTVQSFSVNLSNVKDISNESVALLAPTNALVFKTIDTINFSWETVLNTDSYTIQIATPDFENAIEIIKNETITTTAFSMSNLEAKNYEWRVKAQNLEYETIYTTQSFTVEE